MLREMRIIISSLLLILSLHFLLRGISFRKQINLCKKKKETISDEKKVKKNTKDNFASKNVEIYSNEVDTLIRSGQEIAGPTDYSKELLNSIQCTLPPVVSVNKYADDKNDSNFQSNVLNTNRFYQKNTNETPYLSSNKSINHIKENKLIADLNPLSNGNQLSNNPEQWKYKNELVMNGGELLNGVTGFDNLSDQYSSFNGDSSGTSGISGESCKPPTRGATVNDDLRMGMGVPGIERSMVT